MAEGSRDIERVYDTAATAAKLRRLADALESGKAFRIQIANERIHVPKRAAFSIAHERGSDAEEIEFQFTWSLEGDDDSDDEVEV